MELVDFETFAEQPFGRSTAGDGWLRFYPSPALAGFVMWGVVSETDVAALVRVLEIDMAAVTHVTLVDVRRVKGGDGRGFAQLQAYARRQRGSLGRIVTKMAIVRPEGFLGATAAGFFGIEEAPCPVETFPDRAQALAWLGVADAGLDEEIERQIDCVSGTPPFLRDLRVLLDARPTLASADEVARAMRVSSRTMQRRLAELETTLSREVGLARVRAAKRLLVQTDMKLSQIAIEVGCASPSHLSALFRRVTGQTPVEWRRDRG